MTRARLHPLPRRPQAGESAVGYLVAVALLSLALAVGPDSPLEQLFRAVATHYARFTHAISLP